MVPSNSAFAVKTPVFLGRGSGGQSVLYIYARTTLSLRVFPSFPLLFVALSLHGIVCLLGVPRFCRKRRDLPPPGGGGARPEIWRPPPPPPREPIMGPNIPRVSAQSPRSPPRLVTSKGGALDPSRDARTPSLRVWADAFEQCTRVEEQQRSGLRAMPAHLPGFRGVGERGRSAVDARPLESVCSSRGLEHVRIGRCSVGCS